MSDPGPETITQRQFKIEWALSVGDLLIAITAILGISASFFTLKSDLQSVTVRLENEILTRAEQAQDMGARHDYLRDYLVESQNNIAIQLSEMNRRLARMEGNAERD